MTEAKAAKADPKTMADGPQESYPVTFEKDGRKFTTSDPAVVIRLNSTGEWTRKK